MDKRIETILRLLSELEADVRTTDERQFVLNFDALEMPSLVSSIIDFLQPNRDGTLYKVCLPEEIELCREAMKKMEVPVKMPINLAKEADFYNVAENRLQVFERDEYGCHYCGRQLTRFTATLEHLQPVSKGGDNSLGNPITSCLLCNSRRGNRSVMDMLADAKTNTEA